MSLVLSFLSDDLTSVLRYNMHTRKVMLLTKRPVHITRIFNVIYNPL